MSHVYIPTFGVPYWLLAIAGILVLANLVVYWLIEANRYDVRLHDDEWTVTDLKGGRIDRD